MDGLPPLASSCALSEEERRSTKRQLRGFFIGVFVKCHSVKASGLRISVRLLLGWGTSTTSGKDDDVNPRNAMMIDLDPKSMTRLRKWEVLDREIGEAYGGGARERKCIWWGWGQEGIGREKALSKPPQAAVHPNTTCRVYGSDIQLSFRPSS
ncbi:hypothetical protein PM082_019408 [Marasmius tenuissimus]|nr:hypothetical protein PM082_019408 [Marasmius tenuissimus]